MAVRDTRAAKRYATALFDTAKQLKNLSEVERDLIAVDNLLKQVPAFRQMWESPLMPSGRKRDVLAKALGSSIENVTLAFLRLIVDKRREELLEAVIEEMQRLIDAEGHLVRAEAIFAVTPTSEEQTGLISSLEKRTGGEHIELTIRIDPAILGGVVVRMQDTIIDGSVRGTLERLREQLIMEA